LNSVISTRGIWILGTGTFARVTLKLAHILGEITGRGDGHDRFLESFGQKIDGLLGMDFFSEFEVVVVDQRITD
jgi:hypothetical protein